MYPETETRGAHTAPMPLTEIATLSVCTAVHMYEARQQHCHQHSSCLQHLDLCRRVKKLQHQRGLSSPAFYTPAYYLLSRTFLPHFLYRFLPVVTPASRASALPLFTQTRPDRSGHQNIKTKIKSFFAFYTFSHGNFAHSNSHNT